MMIWECKKTKKCQHLLRAFFCLLALSACEKYGAIPYQPSVSGYESEYVDYINAHIKRKKQAGLGLLRNPKFIPAPQDNDAEYQLPSEDDDPLAPPPYSSSYNGEFYGTNQAGTQVSPYQDNDSNYYPLINSGNTFNTRGVYQPFATDNVIPYEEDGAWQDFDEQYYPLIYDY